MDKIIFTEEFCRPENLHPFTQTRQIQDIRVGILTIREKWERILGLPSFDKKEDDYKDLDRSITISDAARDGGACFMIHGNVIPTPKLVRAVRKLNNGEFISVNGSEGIVFRFTKADIIKEHEIRVKKAIGLKEQVPELKFPWDIFQLNDKAMRLDFELLTRKRKSQPASRTNHLIKPSRIFIEKGASIEFATINASAGPVYIGRNAQVMEGCMIRGPFALCEGAVLKMGTRVYGATTVGPYCTAGGEVKNSVMFGYSNKAHDGYLGDSVIGEWCNLGAGTTISNLKNNASDISVWTPGGEINAGRKCGMMMGDYSRTAINSSINTGTIISTCCNVFGAGLTPKYIPAFSWGSEGVKPYDFDKAMRDIGQWKQLKGQAITDDEQKILRYIFDKL
jgi:UDP-N-acetylglucosamine diphosphorylase/glucosamine-1-phosphate N-acetyltransferase